MQIFFPLISTPKINFRFSCLFDDFRLQNNINFHFKCSSRAVFGCSHVITSQADNDTHNITPKAAVRSTSQSIQFAAGEGQQQ